MTQVQGLGFRVYDVWFQAEPPKKGKPQNEGGTCHRGLPPLGKGVGLGFGGLGFRGLGV